MTSVLIGCPVAERAWILERWLDAVEGMITLAGVEAEIICVYTPSEDDTLPILRRRGVEVIRGPQLTRNRDRIDNHTWGDQNGEIGYMAHLRSLLQYEAARRSFDYFFSLDSDIIPTPHTLQVLIDHAERYQADVVAPLVDLNKENLDGRNPSWNFRRRANYEWDDEHPQYDLYEVPTNGDPFEADAVMAAMLLGPKAFNNQWEYHPQGEDLGFAKNATAAGLKQLVVPRMILPHVMRRST